MLGRAQYFLFLLIVFSVSSQVGLHFWPEFAYVNGIRIDYLSPTLYLLDILIVGWFGISLKGKGERGKGKVKVQQNSLWLLILLLCLNLVWNSFFAKSPGAHVFGLVKLFELGLFGWLVARCFKREWIPGFVRILSFSAIVSSTLAIWQFIEKSSVGGLWYFFGERTFSISTVGISTVNLDQQILRPYGAFPHPNLLAFFLFASIVFAYLRISYEKRLWKILLIISIIFSSVALVFTFSRTEIILLICFVLYEIYTNVSPKWRSAVLGFFQIVIPFLLIFALDKYSTFILRGIGFRQELFIQSYEIFKQSPYYGIGLNNFFINQAPLIHTLSPINFQPPHNIFVVSLLSLGLFGWWIVPVGLFFALRNVWQKIKVSSIQHSVFRDFNLGVFIVLIGIIVAGMFDHFFLTLEQGQIMLALILGLAFSNMFLPEVLKKRKSKR